MLILLALRDLFTAEMALCLGCVPAEQALLLLDANIERAPDRGTSPALLEQLPA